MMTQSNGNIRRHPRIHVDVQANVRTRDGRKLLARTRDLSRSGICIITSDALAARDQLLIDLILLIGPTSSSEPLPLRARVVWSTAIASSFQVGAMFDTLSSKEASFLEMFLRYLDGSILPVGAEMDEFGDDELTTTTEDDGDSPSPDEKDDPFRP
jgi:hypothetical protein